MKKTNIILFLSALVLSTLAFGWLRIANMPEEVIARSLDGFKAVKVSSIFHLGPKQQAIYINDPVPDSRDCYRPLWLSSCLTLFKYGGKGKK